MSSGRPLNARPGRRAAAIESGGVHMTEWSEKRRAEVAAEFRKVGGGDWFESYGLTDSLGPLWRECLDCHRMRTIERVTEPDADGVVAWKCGRCGWSWNCSSPS